MQINNDTNGQNKPSKTMSNKKLVLLMSSPMVAPVAFVAVIMFFMFVGCGWFFVAITFFTSICAAAIGIVGIIGAFFNGANGIGAVLLSLGIGLGSLGFVYPTFIIAKEMSKGFLLLHRELMNKGKEIKTKILKGLKEL